MTRPVALAALLFAGCTADAPALPAAAPPDPPPARAADTAAAVTFLLNQQSADGAWRSDVYAAFRDGTALTPLVLAALQDAADAGLPGPDTAAARRKAADYLAGFVTGGAVREPAGGFEYPAYTAALALRALARVEGRAAERAAWVQYLRDRQLTAALGWAETDAHYGGWGYCRVVPRKPDPDGFAPPLTESNLSATLFALDALDAAGALTPEIAAAAFRFLCRLQNADGGFFFVAADPVRNKAGPLAGGFASYGSATADGLRALLLCRGHVPDAADRARRAADWLRANARAGAHPGRYAAAAERNRDAVYFYYAASAARACRAAGLAPPAALGGELARRQRPDGSWANPVELVRENDPLVATSQALAALAALRGGR